VRTKVIFRCDLEAGVGVPELLSYNELSRTYIFAWSSEYACHLCRKDDVDVSVSACVKGVRTTKYMWVYACQEWSEATLPATLSEPCSDVSVSTVTITVVALLVFMSLVLLVVGIAYLYKRYRKVPRACICQVSPFSVLCAALCLARVVEPLHCAESVCVCVCVYVWCMCPCCVGGT
jgi:hypothetical protein